MYLALSANHNVDATLWIEYTTTVFNCSCVQHLCPVLALGLYCILIYLLISALYQLFVCLLKLPSLLSSLLIYVFEKRSVPFPQRRS